MTADQLAPSIAALSRRIHRVFRACLLLMVVSGLGMGALALANRSNVRMTLRTHMTNSLGNPIYLDGPADYVIWVGLGFVVSGFFIAPIYYFDRLLRGYQQGGFYSAENTQLLRTIGLFLVVQQPVLLLYEPLCYWLLMQFNSYGTFLFRVDIEYHHCAIMLLGLVLVMLSRLMALANEAIEERELTV